MLAGPLSSDVRLLMITGAENLSDMFSIFHDGGVARYSANGDNLDLDIEIMYLAERVNPAFRSFHVSIQNVQDISFSTWLKESGVEPLVLRSPAKIFGPKLEILSSEVYGEQIKVICNQPSAECDYCGGELYFSASGATVTDEAGREYSIDALQQLFKDYWDEWSVSNGLAFREA